MTIVALWMVSMFSIITANLGVHANGEILMMKREVRDMSDRADFESALSEAFRIIQQDAHPHEDTPGKDWMGELKLGSSLSGRMTITIQDEESKININHASADLLSEIISEIKKKEGSLRGEKKDIVKGILKMRYEKGLQSLEEILMMENFKKEDFLILRPYLTVYTDKPNINPNTAKPIILKALVSSLSADHASKRMIMSRWGEACPEGGCSFSERDLEPELFAQKLKLPKTPMMMQAIQDLVSKLTVDSETFEIRIKTARGKSASGVFRCRVGQGRPEVMWWHEN